MEDEVWRLRSVEVDLHNALDELADLQIRHDELESENESMAKSVTALTKSVADLRKTLEAIVESERQLRSQLQQAEASLQHYERIDRMKEQDFIVTGDFIDTSSYTTTVSYEDYQATFDKHVFGEPPRAKGTKFEWKPAKDAAFKKKR